jgi:hypothetical protein
MTVVYRPGPTENGSVLVLEPPGIYERVFSRVLGPQEILVGELVLREGRKRYEQVNFPMSAPGFGRHRRIRSRTRPRRGRNQLTEPPRNLGRFTAWRHHHPGRRHGRTRGRPDQL